MDGKVLINYQEFPEYIKSGTIKVSDDQYLKISVDKGNAQNIVIEVKDTSFGGEYFNTFVLDYENAKDFYTILYQMLKQIKGRVI